MKNLFKISQVAFFALAVFACYFFVTSESMNVPKGNVLYKLLLSQKYVGAVVIGLVMGLLSLVYNLGAKSMRVPELTVPDKIIAAVAGSVLAVIIF